MWFVRDKFDSGDSFRPIKETSLRQSGIFKSRKTLAPSSSSLLRSSVRKPSEMSSNEWLALNMTEFFNDISLLYGVIAHDFEELAYRPKKGEGFPKGYEYRIRSADGRVRQCSGPDYVTHVIDSLDYDIDTKFPQDTVLLAERFDATKFHKTVSSMCKRLFRVYAIIYCCHANHVATLDLQIHLNTAFKHFLFFVFEHRLVSDEREFLPLRAAVAG